MLLNTIVTWILVLCVVLIVAVGILAVKEPEKARILFQRIASKKNARFFNDKNREQEQEEQAELLRRVIREECRQMENRIINSFPRQEKIDLSAILQEIAQNRGLLEHLLQRINNNLSVSSVQEKTVEDLPYPYPLYARMVDSYSPLGFHATSLVESEEGACYRITVQSKTEASYQLITDDTVVQEMIGAFNPVITDGCTFNENASVIHKIIPLEEGRLHFDSTVWQIIEKAKIKII